MSAIEVYKFEHNLLGILAFAFIASCQNAGGYWRAEYHLLVRGGKQPPSSGTVKFDGKVPVDGVVEVNDSFMLELALGCAKTEFTNFVTNLPELEQRMWQAAAAEPASPSEVLQTWARQIFPNLHELSLQVESEQIRNYLQPITAFPPIKRNGL